jgi:hypothetical protein
MVSVEFVYPNLSPVHLKSETPRGGLLERWKLAEGTNCTFIEVPCHLIYNKTEETMTNLQIGEFLGEKEIQLLYTKPDEIPSELKYVFHTDPSIGKQNRYGRRRFSEIRWFDEAWSKKYLKMIFSIVNYLGSPPSIIEIHPGDKQNTNNDLAAIQNLILDSFNSTYGFKPLMLLENRTEQFISTGRQISDYWSDIKDKHPDLVKNAGIVLDVQQLHTKTGDRFLKEFELIPEDCLKGFHIHTKHRWPKLNDLIPWRYVFGKIKQFEHSIIINPEIHQKGRVNQAIEFCTNLLNYELSL